MKTSSEYLILVSPNNDWQWEDIGEGPFSLAEARAFAAAEVGVKYRIVNAYRWINERDTGENLA